MKILFVSAEVFPFSKVGGLGDVCGALPPAMASVEHSVTVVTPAYATLDRTHIGIEQLPLQVTIKLGAETITLSVSRYQNPANARHVVYFIEHPALFGTRNVYTDASGQPYADNPRRFLAFQKAVLELIIQQGWAPDVIHCHDNHTALLPVYLKTTFARLPRLARTPSVLTLHNIAYQGLTDMSERPLFDLPEELFTPLQPLEWYGKINPLKAGIIYADVVTTVSPTHAREIRESDQLSGGLRGVLNSRSRPVVGILNGVDYHLWHPARDPFIRQKYDRSNLEQKIINKRHLLEKMHLPESLERNLVIGMVTRLVEQKGLELLTVCLPELLKEELGLVVLGSGEARYQQLLQTNAENYPHKIAVSFGYDDPLAHQIIAGCDLFLMPSRFEPCGMTQMYALRYGTPPLAHRTGGLADSVRNWDGVNGNGFLFDQFTPAALINNVRYARACYDQPEIWRKIQGNGMEQNFSWPKAADEYLRLYQSLVAGKSAF